MPRLNGPRRIALIHDWLTGMRGGEKVLEVFCRIFPVADIFTLVHLPGRVSPTIERHRIRTSPLQSIPGIGRFYRHLLPVMPWAIERFDFRDYDLLISTSHCVAKGAIPPPQTDHWCYCHTPMRYVWDQYDDYFGPGKSSWPVRGAMALIRPRLQRWDVLSSSRVHYFLANSRNVRERIQRIYHREAEVVYPPAETEFYSAPPGPPPASAKEGGPFYLIVSALAPYKRIDLAIDAFNASGKRLLVIGEGQHQDRLRRTARPNIRFLGWGSAEELRWYYAHCTALIFPGEEDFGIVPLEAMAAGAPVIAYRRGGALETVEEGKTGVFFDTPTSAALQDAVVRLERQSFSSAVIKEHAHQFDRRICENRLRSVFVEYASEMS